LSNACALCFSAIVSSDDGSTFRTVSNLAVGATVWNDRDYVFASLPLALVGGLLLQGPHRIPDGARLTLPDTAASIYALLTQSRDGGYLTSLQQEGWALQADMSASWAYANNDVPMDVLVHTTGTGRLTLPAASGADTVVAFVMGE
jgi:hypothetical protein